MQLRFKDIMTRISEYIKSEMYDYFTSLPSDAEQRAFVKKVMHDDPDECTELLDKVTYGSNGSLPSKSSGPAETLGNTNVEERMQRCERYRCSIFEEH